MENENVNVLDLLIEQASSDWQELPPGSEEREKVTNEIVDLQKVRISQYEAECKAENDSAMVEIEDAKAHVSWWDRILDIAKIVVPTLATTLLTYKVMEFEEEGVVKSKAWSWLSKHF